MTFFPLQLNVEGRVSWSENWLLKLELSHWDKCVCIYAALTRAHIHTPRFNPRLGSHPFKKSFGWHPYKEILDLVTWGGRMLLRSCDQSEEMNEFHFLRLCMSAVHLTSSWVFTPLSSCPEGPIPKRETASFSGLNLYLTLFFQSF